MSRLQGPVLGLALTLTCLSILFQLYVLYLLADMRINLPGWGGLAAWMVIVTGLTYLVAPATLLSLVLAILFTRKRPDVPGARFLAPLFWVGTFFPLLTWAALATSHG